MVIPQIISKFKDLKTKFTKIKLKYWVFPSHKLSQCDLLLGAGVWTAGSL
jgi:hypothetical protein